MKWRFGIKTDHLAPGFQLYSHQVPSTKRVLYRNFGTATAALHLLPWSDSYITVTEALTLKRLGTLHLEPHPLSSVHQITFCSFLGSNLADFPNWTTDLTWSLPIQLCCLLPTSKDSADTTGELLSWWPVGPSTVRLLVVTRLASVRLTGEGGPLDNKVK